MNSQTHDRSNNFDALRLVGAVLVIVGHAYSLKAIPNEPGLWGVSISTLGLVIFFSVSGYLITQSWSRDRRLIAYLLKRSLRIFPGLLVAVVFSMLVVGTLATTMPLTEYFTRTSLWAYLSNAVLSPVYALPGVFTHIPYPNAVNGSLWSLPVEFACYIMVPVVGLLPPRIRAGTWLTLGIGSGLLSLVLVSAAARIVFWGTDLSQASSVWVYFMVAAALAEMNLASLRRLDSALIALVSAAVVTAVLPTISVFVWWLVLPLVVTSLGQSSTPMIRRAGRFGDFSYGMYLYGFPIQQLIIFLAPGLRFSASVGLTLVASVLLASLSWWAIERRALALKPRPARTRDTTPKAVGAQARSLTGNPDLRSGTTPDATESVLGSAALPEHGRSSADR